MHPSGDIFATAHLAATSCSDHLLGLADVLSALYATYTLTRGAVEAASIGCYLADRYIDGRERVRRTMNYRLAAMRERVWLFKDMHSTDSVGKPNDAKQRIADFARGAGQNGFAFHDRDGTFNHTTGPRSSQPPKQSH